MTIKILSLLFCSTVVSKPSFAMMIFEHVKCRGGVYPQSEVQRLSVPDDKVNWTTEFKNYHPPDYTSESIHGRPWADPKIDDPNFKPKWNSLDDKISRVSHTGIYQIVNGRPQNPVGRTGIAGRGILGRWGPNHAADPVVTRWKKLKNGEVAMEQHTKLPILQFVAIKRRDTGEWALPGGMVDPGEIVTATAIREFQEEATNSIDKSEEQKAEWQAKFKEFFSAGEELYRDYVDDPRNTDNSWMETVAYNFHDELGDTVGSLTLHAGDDAVGARWVDVHSKLKLYASHKAIVQKATEKLRAHY